MEESFARLVIDAFERLQPVKIEQQHRAFFGSPEQQLFQDNNSFQSIERRKQGRTRSYS
jgi:hypothetical protein